MTGVPETSKGALARLGLRLVPAHDADRTALLAFEVANREHFRRWIPDRGDAYYDASQVGASLAAARRWWDDGTDRMHVVLDREDHVVARANLTEVRDGRAQLGYRVAEPHGGRGIATAAVSDLLALAPGWGITRVEAVTSAVNLASARVLERCGFVRTGARAAALPSGPAMQDAVDWTATVGEPSPG